VADRLYYVSHKEEAKEYNHEHYRLDIEKSRSNSRKRQKREMLEKPERQRARKRKYADKPESIEKKRIYSYNWVRTPEGKAKSAINYALRRARKAGVLGSHTSEEWETLKESHKHLCSNCKQKRKLTKDHIISQHHGGSDYIWNIQPLCGPCNRKKWYMITAGTQLGIFDKVRNIFIST